MAIVCECGFFTTIHGKKIIDHWIKYSKCHVIRSYTKYYNDDTQDLLFKFQHTHPVYLWKWTKNCSARDSNHLKKKKNKSKKIAYFSCVCALAHFLFCCSQQYIQSKNWHSPSYTFTVFLFVNACYNLHLIYLYILFV